MYYKTPNMYVTFITPVNDVNIGIVTIFSFCDTKPNFVAPPPAPCNVLVLGSSYVEDFPSSPSDDGEATGSRSDYDDGEWTKGPSRTPRM